MIQTFWAHLYEIVIGAGAVVMVAVVGGVTTEIGPWYESLRFPALKPPDWAFGPGWTLILALIATAGVVAWNDAPNAATRSVLITVFVVNAVLNMLWSPLFFKAHRPDWALIEIVPFWASVAAQIAFCVGFSPRAAWLLSPYLVWVSFAGWLNWQVVQLNAPFTRRGDNAVG